MWVELISAALTPVGAIVLIAAVIQAVAYMFTNQVTLRLLLLVGTFLYIWYYFVADDTPLWPAIVATTLIGITSIIGFFRLLSSRSKRTISKAHLPIFEQMADIEPGAFRKLMTHATIKTFEGREEMTVFGEVPRHVYYILEGDVDVTKSGFEFASHASNFIGEISVIGGFGATATVFSRAGTRAVVLDRKTLLVSMGKDERFRVAVEALFAKDMAIKLAQAAKVADPMNYLFCDMDPDRKPA